VARFYRLLQITKERQKFLVHPLQYYQKIYEILSPAGLIEIFIAQSNSGEDLAAVFIFKFGRRIWYMYGASNNEQRALMPNHLLHWEVIRWAKAQGCTSYDLWGIPRNANPQQTLWGVLSFKSGFNGQIMNWAGCLDYPFNELKYQFLLKAGYFIGDTQSADQRQLAEYSRRRNMKLVSLVEALKPLQVIGEVSGEFGGINHDSRQVQKATFLWPLPA